MLIKGLLVGSDQTVYFSSEDHALDTLYSLSLSLKSTCEPSNLEFKIYFGLICRDCVLLQSSEDLINNITIDTTDISCIIFPVTSWKYYINYNYSGNPKLIKYCKCRPTVEAADTVCFCSEYHGIL